MSEIRWDTLKKECHLASISISLFSTGKTLNPSTMQSNYLGILLCICFQTGMFPRHLMRVLLPKQGINISLFNLTFSDKSTSLRLCRRWDKVISHPKSNLPEQRGVGGLEENSTRGKGAEPARNTSALIWVLIFPCSLQLFYPNGSQTVWWGQAGLSPSEHPGVQHEQQQRWRFGAKEPRLPRRPASYCNT